MLAANQLLQNRYRISRRLGHGGMGAVYEAIDETFGEPIALKEIIIESAAAEHRNSILKAFEREAKSLAKARHEAIPFVRDYFSEAGRQFLVMELVEGSDFGEMLAERQTPFPVEDAVRWLDQLLDALDYLHNLTPPIIHRDIKPQNLKLTPRGKIKLLDFGIAKSTSADSTATSQTFVGATLEYSPIEQLLRVINPTFREFIILKHETEAQNVLQQTTDARCDIYSLGATFYHLLTNQPPTDSTKRTLEVWAGNPDLLPNVAQLNPSVSAPLAACLHKALEIDRADRFATAAEMRTALQAAIAAEKDFPVRAGNSEFSDDVRKSDAARKNETVAAAPVTVAFDIAPSTTQADSQSFASEFSSPVSIQSAPTLPSTESAAAATFAPSVETIGANEKPARKSWTLPAAALGVLAFGGLGAAVLVNNSNSANSNQPSANTTVAAPTAAPSAAQSPSVEPTAAPTQIAVKPDEDPKPVISPKTGKSPVQTGTKKPSPKTPDAKPAGNRQETKPAQDPNCVFTNSCQ